MINLKDERLKRKLTQAQVASSLGIDAARYCRIEKKNRAPTLQQAKAIAEFFGLNVMEIDFLEQTAA